MSDSANVVEEAALTAGRRLFAGPCSFVRGVTRVDDLPPPEIGEVAFAGRSNVGKSSLLNALSGRSSLARTSNTPGRTQEINFFRLGSGEESIMLVDLPGYGYAKAPRKRVDGWISLVRRYLSERPNLRRVMLLVDARHGLKDTDRDVMRMLDQAAVSYQLVLTKADKLKPDERDRAMRAVTQEAHAFIACHPTLHMTSAVKRWGLDALRAEIAAIGRI